MFIIGGVLWFLLGFGIWILFFHSQQISDDTKNWGDFGVFIAGFSGTGVAVITLFAVAYGIRVQARDLAKSREFMREQSKTMADQAGTSAQQAFDSVFFSLLDRFSKVRDDVSYPYSSTAMNDRTVTMTETAFAHGRDAFKKFYADFKEGADPVIDGPTRVKQVKAAFMKVYREHESEFGPYFRTLYQIYKWIDRGRLTPQQQNDYAKIARAQLSDIELRIIFYNGLTDLAEKMKPLIVKYGILKHVNAGYLLKDRDKGDLAFYDSKAFD